MTEIEGTLFALLLLGLWWVDDRAKRPQHRQLAMVSVLLLAVAMVTLLSLVPRSDSGVVHPGHLTLTGLIAAGVKSMLRPGRLFDDIFWFAAWGGYRDILMWVLLAGLLVRPRLALAGYLGVVGTETIFRAIYPGALRHEGLVLVWLLAMYWLARRQAPVPPTAQPAPARQVLHRVGLYGGLGLVLSMGVWQGMDKIVDDWQHPYSCAKPFAAWLRTQPDLRDAVLISEPDCMNDTFTYFLPNQCYYPREQFYGTCSSLTARLIEDQTLGQWLAKARRVQQETRRPVLLLVRPELEPAPGAEQVIRMYSAHDSRRVIPLAEPGTAAADLDKGGLVLRVSPADMIDFTAATERLFSLGPAISFEQFTVYRLREPTPPVSAQALPHD